MSQESNCYSPNDPSITSWLLRYIMRQTQIESLDWIAAQIKADAADGFAYTKDETQMTELREAFQRQMAHARQEQ